MKTFKQFNEDMAVAGSSGPTNVVSGGAIAGTGERGGEPGVYLNRRKRVVLQPITKRKKPR